MRPTKLLVLALWLCLWGTPVFAGIAQIAGTGTNGAIANTAFSAGATINLTTTHDLPIGSLAIVITQGNASGTLQDFSCSDAYGNGTYSSQGVTNVTAASVKINYVYTAADIPNGGTITCTVSGGNGFSATAIGFSGTASSPYDSASPAGVTGSGTGTLTIGPTGTLNGPCGSANCEVLIGAGMTRNQNGNITMDANFTAVTVLTSSPYMDGFWIVSASTPRSFAPSTASTSGNYALQLQGFKAAAAASTKRLLLNSVP